MRHSSVRQTVLTLCATAFASLYAGACLADVKCWTESPGTIILSDRPAGTGNAIAAHAVRNAFASGQIGLRSDAAVDEPLSFEWTTLKGPSGEIAHDQITLFRAADVHVDHVEEKVDAAKDPVRARPLGDYPDALVPLLLPDGTNVANSIKLEADHTASFWVDVYVPQGTGAGTYAGNIELKQGGKTVATVPVKVDVANVEIPLRSTLPSLFDLRLHPHIRANLDAYVAETIKNRIQPFTYHYLDYVEKREVGFTMMDKLTPYPDSYACVYVSDTKVPTGARADALIAQLKEVTEHLKQKGQFDRAFMYLKDEPDSKEVVGMVGVAKFITDAIPEWKGKLLDTLNKEGNDLDPQLTYIARALKIYGGWYMQTNVPGGREAWDERRAKGQHLWFYVSNAQGVPFPTFDVNTPNIGFEPRMLGWAYWFEKADGHLYWDLLYEPKWELNKKFPPGDGQIMYPGDFSLPGAPAWVQIKDLKGPVPSRRLKMQRQGLEEWELLKMAEKKVGREKVAAVVAKVYTCLGKRSWAPDAYDPKNPMWSYTEAGWDDARDQIIDMLLH